MSIRSGPFEGTPWDRLANRRVAPPISRGEGLTLAWTQTSGPLVKVL